MRCTKLRLMSDPATGRATYEDLLAVHEHVVAEIIDGALRTHPRPGSRQALAASWLGGELYGPFTRGKGGPGGGIILDEPELHLRANIFRLDNGLWVLLGTWRDDAKVRGEPFAAFELELAGLWAE